METPKSYTDNLGCRLNMLRISTRLCLLFSACMIISTAWGYRIKGRFEGLQECWYPMAYLAVIDDVNGFYTADSQKVIAQADIDSAGNFVIEGNDLPDDPMFYRLYFSIKEEENIFIRKGSFRNYLVLALSNKSEITLDAPNVCSSYFGYTVSGSDECAAISRFQGILDGFDKASLDSLGNAKRRFMEDQHLEVLYSYVDTSAFLMTALWALTETDIPKNYGTHQQRYDDFIQKFALAHPHSPYVAQLRDLMNVEAFRQTEKTEPVMSITTVSLLALLLFSALLNIFLYKQQQKKKKKKNKETFTGEDYI